MDVKSAQIERRVKRQNAATARAHLVEATIKCLNKYGYSETTINRIQKEAGISRGALTHHFPNKEDLIVATIAQLLSVTLRPALPSKKTRRTDIHADIHYIATTHTRSFLGHALVEVLVAIRTDKTLHLRVQAELQKWNDDIDKAILGYYKSTHHDDEDVILLWTIARTFLRGLVLQEGFTPDRDRIEKIIRRFSELLEPHLQRRRQE